MSYRCVICEHDFDEESLEDAIEITGGRGSRSRKPVVYQFPDGSLHHLVKSKKQPQLPAPELQATSSAGSEELLQEVALAALPTPPVPVEIKTQPLPLIEPDIEGDESQPMSTMQLAFRRIQEK